MARIRAIPNDLFNTATAGATIKVICLHTFFVEAVEALGQSGRELRGILWSGYYDKHR